VVPIVLVTFPAAVQSLLWERFRLPWGATVCVLGLLFGEWINRYFNFWGWTYFPITLCFPSQIVPGAILLDTALMLSGSYLFTAIVGAMGWGLIFYPGNWPVIAPYHVPVEYNGMLMSVADLLGYHYVRTGTPEYIRMVEKGTLRTFGKDVAPVSAFFSAFMSILIYFIWHFVGRWFSTVKFIKQS
jgi:methane/ammonia monooxygenase subunit A